MNKDYDPAPILKQAMDHYLQEEREEQLAHEESVRTFPMREERVKKEIAEVRHCQALMTYIMLAVSISLFAAALIFAMSAVRRRRRKRAKLSTI